MVQQSVDTHGSAVPESIPAPVGKKPPSTARGGRLHRWARRYAFGGLIVALIFLWLSATPSLLPRDPLFQGLVSGASAAIGYSIGVFLTWLARFLVSRDEPWPRPPRWAWLTLGVVAVAGTAIMFSLFALWQNDVRDLMGVERLAWTSYVLVVLFTVLVFLVLMSLGQLWGTGVKRLSRWLSRYIPPRISGAIGAAVAITLTVLVLNGVVAEKGMSALNASFAAANNETKADSVPPTSPLRSGGPGSLVTWDSLGREGRVIISKGPTKADLEQFNGAPALDPIRTYAGLDSADSLKDRADLVARELERTGGFQRKVVAVGATTGSGWINKATIDSLEYMYNGDTALASMQYSYLPSWISFLVDKERARQAGLALFEAVSTRIQAMPEAERPKLVVFGESLGSFGGEAAFGTIPDIAARTDGALFSGPTFNNSLWRDTTNQREPGTPEILPIFEDGAIVRFAADQADLARPDSPWGKDRVVYLQHASDPITWWSPRLLLNKPDWLKEPPGPDVLDAMQWAPFVTFLQVSADMAVSTNVPDGHGHDYMSAIPYSWTQILQPPGWTDAKTEKLLPLLSRDGN
ncbi:alpha/beta hydrolase [Aldersonia kunmingensis]|uniref:alpha/beta hydrolase n=1 Tax=Aldersonia kunmingensis TaxID=408066 RepID=UPI0008374A2B|nr:alpha/beta-hydrolase family protein [Aldersonia kunmingensis]